MLRCAFGRGELLLKSGLNKKNCRFGRITFKTALKFFTRVEGGCIGGPNSPYGTFFIKLTSILVYVFYDYFFTQLYGPSYVKHILDGAKNSNDSTEIRHKNFSPV
jgi:hypothetical protein